MSPTRIEAVAFDCYGTLVDFGDEAFRRAYEVILREQQIPVEGSAFYDKWMEIWRRLALDGSASDTGSVGVVAAVNTPAALSEAETIPAHPDHHTPSAGRDRTLNGPRPKYRAYSEEWPEHFALCFEELGVTGNPQAAHERLVELLREAQAFPEARRVVEQVARRLPTAVMSNADDDFLHACLQRNGLVFPVVVSSQSANSYKPHVSIFEDLVSQLGVAAESVLYVGDSRLADIVGAKHAGLQAAWVRRPSAINRSLDVSEDDAETRDTLLASYRPDYEIASLDEIIPLISL